MTMCLPTKDIPNFSAKCKDALFSGPVSYTHLAAVRAVGGKFFVPDVGSHLSGHILRVGEGVPGKVATDIRYEKCV